MTYGKYIRSKKATPASQPVIGRENEMVSTKSGAVLFKTDIFDDLRRTLITGTATSTFYTGKFELTKDFEVLLVKCAKEDGKRTADVISLVSDQGLAVRNDSCLFALAVLSKYAPTEFKRVAHTVVRTLSHFHMFVSFVKEYRGTGGVVSKFGKSWFNNMPVDKLTYQILKYPQRNGFSIKDQLRIFKPNPGKEQDRERLFAYAVGKEEKYGPQYTDLVGEYQTLNQLGWYEWLKADPTSKNAIKAIEEAGLSHEMVTPLGVMNQAVWEALFQKMPMTATLRNLGNLSSHGVFNSKENRAALQNRIVNEKNLRKARIHPYDLLLAARVYASGGNLYGTRSSKTWTPNNLINSALEDALALSFTTQEATGNTFFNAIDVSGSMSTRFGQNRLISCSEVAAMMALITAKVEPDNYVYGFCHKMKNLGITSKDTFLSATQKAMEGTVGGTNAGQVYDFAIDRNLHIDTFAFYTDSMSWGGTHAFQQLNKYRKAINPNARAVYVTITAGYGGLADPKDPNSLAIGGFDPTAPKIIQQFSQGLI